MKTSRHYALFGMLLFQTIRWLGFSYLKGSGVCLFFASQVHLLMFLFDTMLNLFLVPRLYCGSNNQSWKGLVLILCEELEIWSKQP